MLAGVRRQIRSWSLLHRTVLSLVAVATVSAADRLFDDFRDAVAKSFSATGELWRWFLASAFVVVAGVAVGLAARAGPPGRRFSTGRTLAMAVVPLYLALTLPMVVWGWPGPRMGSWPWSLRTRFFHEPLTVAMWLIVGIAVASGFRDADET